MIMVITDVMSASKKEPKDLWRVVDGEHYTYLTRDDTGMRIKIDRTVSLKGMNITQETIELDPRHSVIVNDPKNMNPIIDYVEEIGDLDACYVILTLSGDLDLLRYKWYKDIKVVSTFKGKDGLTGCILRFDEYTKLGTEAFGELKCWDKNEEQFITMMLMSHKTTTIQRVTDKKEWNSLKGIQTKYKKPLRFKIDANRLVTKTYITTESHKDQLFDILNQSDIKDPWVYVLPDNIKGISDEEFDESLDQIRKKKVRAVTEFGVQLPFDVICKLRILYIFMMDVTDDVIKVKCIKGA